MRNLVVLIFIFSVVSFAKGTAKYGWIDMQESITSVEEGKRILKNLESELKINQDQIKKEQLDFQKLNDEFEKKSMVMNEKTKEEKKMELQTKYLKLQENMARFQQEIQIKQNRASKEIFDKISTIVKDYASNKGYKYIFEKNALIFKPDGEDITKEIIALYDKKFK